MKTWKTVSCLLLLCVIIGGCVALGRNTEASAATQTPPSAPEQPQAEQPTSAPSAPENGSATTDKTYSEGLYFRSNGDGTCALAGLGSCTAACILIPPKSPAGDVVTEILPHALADSIIGSIEIPETVTVLSAASFAGCERLAYVRVAAGNTQLMEYDGVLYTADGGTLLYCPAGRNARELKLHAALTRIAAGAFASCHALDTVRYHGSTASWHNVIVGDENNALYEARLIFEG